MPFGPLSTQQTVTVRQPVSVLEKEDPENFAEVAGAAFRTENMAAAFATGGKFVGFEDDPLVQSPREEEPGAAEFRAVTLSADVVVEFVVEVDHRPVGVETATEFELERAVVAPEPDSSF